MSKTQYKKFTFGEHLTDEQIAFFNRNGFIHFQGFTTREKVDEMLSSTENLQNDWIENKVEKIKGVPIKYGVDVTGQTIVHRFPFTSQFSEPVKRFIQDSHFQELKRLLPEGARIAENEKDGVIFNHYVNTESSNFRQMGWHTDSMRDIFYGKKIMPMLNVGLYLDDSSESNGGLRILPGTHRQNIMSMMFRKAYFLNNGRDKNEMLVDARAGDLVIHDGRIWHRVAMAPVLGEASRRRGNYVAFFFCALQPQREQKRQPPVFQLLQHFS